MHASVIFADWVNMNYNKPLIAIAVLLDCDDRDSFGKSLTHRHTEVQHFFFFTSWVQNILVEGPSLFIYFLTVASKPQAQRLSRLCQNILLPAESFLQLQN